MGRVSRFPAHISPKFENGRHGRFGADPYLSGEGAYETISGIQSQGVQAVAKHFINKWVQLFYCEIVNTKTYLMIYTIVLLLSLNSAKL